MFILEILKKDYERCKELEQLKEIVNYMQENETDSDESNN